MAAEPKPPAAWDDLSQNGYGCVVCVVWHAEKKTVCRLQNASVLNPHMDREIERREVGGVGKKKEGRGVGREQHVADSSDHWRYKLKAVQLQLS